MIRIFVWLLLLYAGYRMLRYLMRRDDFTGRSPSAKERAEPAFMDPVCGRYVAGDDAVVGTHDGKRIYFCSMKCLDSFRESLELSEKGGNNEVFH